MKLFRTMLIAALIMVVAGSFAASGGARLETAVFYVA